MCVTHGSPTGTGMAVLPFPWRRIHGPMLQPSTMETIKSLAEYRMDEDFWIAGQAGDVKDSSGNSFHGTPSANAVIKNDDPDDLCNSAEFTSNGFIEITGLPFATPENGDKTTVCFWMKWAGEGGMPIGWDTRYDLYFSGDRFGFNTGCSDVFGISL